MERVEQIDVSSAAGIRHLLSRLLMAAGMSRKLPEADGKLSCAMIEAKSSEMSG